MKRLGLAATLLMAPTLALADGAVKDEDLLRRRLVTLIKPIVDPEGVEELESEPVSVSALDLNLDGRTDYVAQLTNADAYCTPQGCMSFVAIQGKKGELKIVGQLFAWKMRVDASSVERKGYHDLLVTQDSKKETRYVFNGSRYLPFKRNSSDSD